jgi:hypothetical protein
MTSTTEPTTTPPADESPSLAVAGQIIDGLAVRDFDAVVAALADDVHFRALLPNRVLDLDDRDAVRATFDTWFGGAERWDLVEAVVGEVGGRVHLRWRLNVTNPQVGPGNLMVEQQVYADAGPDGRLRDVSLMCTGYRPQPS